jgi:hypothetical protein
MHEKQKRAKPRASTDVNVVIPTSRLLAIHANSSAAPAWKGIDPENREESIG